MIGHIRDVIRRRASISGSPLDTRFACLVLGTATALVTVVWVAISVQVAAEREAAHRSLIAQTTNISYLFASSANSVAAEMDRILRYLRSTYVRNGYQADWPALVQAEFTANKRSVQIAVIDVNGMMITSSKMLHPTRTVDLSFRKHYQVHAVAKIDQLYISEPLIGKASKKWSVQFTRPFFTDDGKFNGVIVVSLDPSFLTREYSTVDLGPKGGLALVGDDGIIRANSGRYSNLLGRTFPDANLPLPKKISNTKIQNARQQEIVGSLITISQQSKDFPFRVITTRDGTAALSALHNKRLRYHFGGTLLTALILFTVVAGAVKRHRYEGKLNNLARNDSLTNLANRWEFIRQLDGLLSERKGRRTKFNMVLVDLDDFKTVNDTHGHPAADEVLKTVAGRLQRIVRSDDLVARLGGDEFAIIQKNCNDEASATGLALRICNKLAEPYNLGGTLIEAGASAGVVTKAETFEDNNSILTAADLALYAAKHSGRGRFRFFEHQMTDAAKARSDTEKGLRAALQNDEFKIHYQPIVNMSDRKITGVEALLRWTHPTRGMVSPGDFIPVAEQTGLISQIGVWVVEKACKDVADHSDYLKLAINISVIEFRDTDVAGTIRRALKLSGLAPSRLKIEITESLLLRNTESARIQLTAIKNLGVMIAMDDFGTGYSSLSYLHKYPIDQIKIDQSFVRGIGTVEHAAALINTIVKLAECMKIKTVAEGIETEGQFSIVAKTGCDEAQGYLFSRPVPLSEIPKHPILYVRKKLTSVVAV